MSTRLSRAPPCPPSLVRCVASADTGSSTGGSRRVGDRHTATRRSQETLGTMSTLYGSLALPEDVGAGVAGAGSDRGGGGGRGPFSTGRSVAGLSDTGASRTEGGGGPGLEAGVEGGAGGQGGASDPSGASPPAPISPVRVHEDAEGDGGAEGVGAVPPISWGDLGTGGPEAVPAGVPQRVLDMITPRDPPGPPQDTEADAVHVADPAPSEKE
jgi:hypothetical protein